MACIAFVRREIWFFYPERTFLEFPLTGFGPGPQYTRRFPRTHIPALPQPLQGCGPEGLRPRKRRAVVRPPLPPGKRSVWTGGLARGSAAEVATRRETLRDRTRPAYYAPSVSTVTGRTPASGTVENREGERPLCFSNGFPKLQPQSSRRGTAPARAPAEPQ